VFAQIERSTIDAAMTALVLAGILLRGPGAPAVSAIPLHASPLQRLPAARCPSTPAAAPKNLAQGAAPASRSPPPETALAVYRKEVETWRREREERLKADGGWLTVAGLFWLEPGVNRFGAAASNDIVLPSPAPPQAGSFVLESGRITVDVAPGVPVTLGGNLVTRMQLRSDADGAAPDVLALGALTFQVIERGGRLAVRLKDANSAARRSFKGLTWYPVKAEYRVTAQFTPYDKPIAITVPSIIGVAEPMMSPGFASFELAGHRLRLDPVSEPGETRLFFVIRDATSGRATYGGGRFLYADPPRDGRIVLDFNEAYSPPCAFTPYATCPLPPPQNRLPISVEAGEKTPEH
jgi:uncharacterized protein (DUF1684 family)